MPLISAIKVTCLLLRCKLNLKKEGKGGGSETMTAAAEVL